MNTSHLCLCSCLLKRRTCRNDAWMHPALSGLCRYLSALRAYGAEAIAFYAGNLRAVCQGLWLLRRGMQSAPTWTLSAMCRSLSPLCRRMPKNGCLKTKLINFIFIRIELVNALSSSWFKAFKTKNPQAFTYGFFKSKANISLRINDSYHWVSLHGRLPPWSDS